MVRRSYTCDRCFREAETQRPIPQGDWIEVHQFGTVLHFCCVACAAQHYAHAAGLTIIVPYSVITSDTTSILFDGTHACVRIG